MSSATSVTANGVAATSPADANARPRASSSSGGGGKNHTSKAARQAKEAESVADALERAEAEHLANVELRAALRGCSDVDGMLKGFASFPKLAKLTTRGSPLELGCFGPELTAYMVLRSSLARRAAGSQHVLDRTALEVLQAGFTPACFVDAHCHTEAQRRLRTNDVVQVALLQPNNDMAFPTEERILKKKFGENADAIKRAVRIAPPMAPPARHGAASAANGAAAAEEDDVCAESEGDELVKRAPRRRSRDGTGGAGGGSAKQRSAKSSGGSAQPKKRSARAALATSDEDAAGEAEDDQAEYDEQIEEEGTVPPAAASDAPRRKQTPAGAAKRAAVSSNSDDF